MKSLITPLALLLLASPAIAQDFVRSKDASVQAEIERRVNAINDLGILTFKSDDNNFIWNQDMRLLVQAGGYFGNDAGNQQRNGANIGEVRLSQNFVFNHDYIVQTDLEFDTGNSFKMQDMYIGYIGWDNTMLRFGQNKAPFGFDNLISDRFITFLERPSMFAWKPGRQVGVTYSHWGKRWQMETGVYTESANDADTTGVDAAVTYAGRTSFAPVMNDQNVIHLGISGYQQQPKAANSTPGGPDDTMSYKASDESSIDLGNRLKTPKITFVKYARAYDAELAMRLGSFYWQAEYSQNKVYRLQNLPQPVFSGAYVSCGYFFGGYKRSYQPTLGEWGRVIPTHKWGELELAARYSYTNLNDAKTALDPTKASTTSNLIVGGKEDVATLELNWYQNYNSRMMFNLSRVKTDQYAIGDRAYKPNDSYNYIEVRWAVYF